MPHLAVLAGQDAAPQQPGEQGQGHQSTQHAGQDDDPAVNHLARLRVQLGGGRGRRRGDLRCSARGGISENGKLQNTSFYLKARLGVQVGEWVNGRGGDGKGRDGGAGGLAVRQRAAAGARTPASQAASQPSSRRPGKQPARQAASQPGLVKSHRPCTPAPHQPPSPQPLLAPVQVLPVMMAMVRVGAGSWLPALVARWAHRWVAAQGERGQVRGREGGRGR